MILGIYGASGLGREVAITAKKINSMQHRWEKIIFVDDNSELTNIVNMEVHTLDYVKNEYHNIEIVVAVGEPAVREILYHKLKENNIKIATLIHPGVYIDESTKISEGVVISEGVTITSCVEVKENVYIQPHAVIGHDIQIGAHSVIGSNCQIGGATVIGKRVFMGFLAGTVQNLKIGDDVICSPGAIVFRDVESEMTVVGNPARAMKKNENKRVFK